MFRFWGGANEASLCRRFSERVVTQLPTAVWSIGLTILGFAGLGFVGMDLTAEELPIWTSVTGTSISAELVRVEGDNFHLRDNRSQTHKVNLSKLDERSRSLGYSLWLDRRDSEQFRLVRQHLAGLEERPEAKGRILLEIHKRVPESPYAGLWGAVAFSAGTNDLQVARQMITQTISRIRTQQKLIPGRHTTTLAAACNNYAIISLKDSGSTSCAGQLNSAMKSTSLLGSIVRHNVEQLINLDTTSNPQLALSTSMRRKITEQLVTTEVNSTGPSLKPGWYYSLNVDVPQERLGAARRIPGIEAPSAAMELVNIGTGVVVAPGIVVTTKEAIDPSSSRQVGLLTVGTTQSGRLKTLNVKSCLRAPAESRIDGGSFFRSSWGNMVDTSFRFIRPMPNSVEGQVAALHVPGLDLPPATVANDVPGGNTELMLLGYQRGNNVSNGVISIDGKVESNPDGSGKQLCNHELAGGQLGGPLVDGNGSILGIACRLKPNPTELGCEFYSGRVLRSWFSRHVPISALKDADSPDHLDFREVKGSVVPIFGWGLRQSMTALSEMDDGVGPSESLLIEDDWCMVCGGRGFFSCPDCVDGTTTYKEKAVVGYTKVSGNIYGTVNKKQRCRTCAGKGAHDCPNCENGKRKQSF